MDQAVPSTPRPSQGASSHPQVDDDLFRFCIRNANPELWRTTVPLVVRVRCKRHKGLVATWTAIHWLIVLYAAKNRRAFGVREIAAEAGVGRNELTGPNGYIQRLVDLGLLRVVGSLPARGQAATRGLRDTPIYAIDLWELERESMALVPEILRAEGLPPPLRPAPDPRQLSFLATIGGKPESGTGLYADAHGSVSLRHEPVPAWPDCVHEPMHETGTALASADSLTHETGTVMHGIRTELVSADSLTHETGTAMHPVGTVMHETGTVWPEDVPADAPNRDVREKDQKDQKEGERRLPLADASLLVSAIRRTMLELIEAGAFPSLSAQPTPLRQQLIPPPGQAAITSSLHDLWGADREQVRQRDLLQLDLLAGTYDAPTGGYGAYWVGRAILMAEGCLEGRAQRPSVAYLKAILKRWETEGSWGSDTDAPAVEEGLMTRTPPAPRLVTPPAAPPARGEEHPAVRAYVEALHETPNAVQAAQIAETVSDLTAWGQVLTDWQLNGWGERSVGKMLDRYQKSTSGTAAGEAPPSVAAIHTYLGLTPEQRDRWIRKFHAAATPAEKRAVLNRLEQEHPR